MANQSAMGAFFGRETFEVVSMILGIAMVGLLVSNAKSTSSIITSAGDTLSNLISVATFQRKG